MKVREREFELVRGHVVVSVEKLGLHALIKAPDHAMDAQVLDKSTTCGEGVGCCEWKHR
jgi:hypothetical protein